MFCGAAAGAVAYGGYTLAKTINDQGYIGPTDEERYAQYSKDFDTAVEEERKKKYNTNPFEGPVSGEVVVVDEAGNAISVPSGNWLTGSQDGKWIQEMQPGNKPEGHATGTRKDGGHPQGPKHSDPRALEPHAHIPGVFNPDGTPWLPLK